MAKDNTNFFKRKNEWSEIKDKLLGCYLPPYFQKVLTSGSPICYVDCFAGKGTFDDGNPGSPLIALKARENCLSNSKIKIHNDSIKAYFIELNHANELINNVKNHYTSLEHINIISGKYEEEIDKILRSKKGTNIFLYIDPYGIRALDFEIFERFNNYQFRSIEMLINFNTFGFFRDACRVMNVKYNNDPALQGLEDLVEYAPTILNSSAESKKLLNKIAGGDYWQDITTQYSHGKFNGYTAEQLFSTEYKKQLQKKYCYVLDMPIRLKPAQRPKYRMIHVCNHEDGCFLMGKNMQSRKDELFMNIQQNGCRSLLSCFPNDAVSIENQIIPIKDISQKLLKEIRQIEKARLKKLIANFINKHGLICDFDTIHKILKDLESKDFIEIIRKPAFTKTGKKASFWEDKKGQEISIWRKNH